MFGYAIRIMGLTKFLSINDSVVATVETPKYKFGDIKLFFSVLNSYFVDFTFKLDKRCIFWGTNSIPSALTNSVNL